MLVVACQEVEGGRLHLKRAMARTGPEGTFQVELPASTLREFRVYREWSPEGLSYEDERQVEESSEAQVAPVEIVLETN